MPTQRADGVWVSDDGLYYWNGTAWTATEPPPTAAAPATRTSRWPLYVLAGCGALLALVVVLVAVFAFVLLTAAKSLGGCPPADFPVPSSARTTNVSVGSYTGGNVCRLEYSDSETGDAVESFYRTQHSAWETAGFDQSSATFHLRRQELKADVQVLSAGGSSQIRAEIHT